MPNELQHHKCSRHPFGDGDPTEDRKARVRLREQVGEVLEDYYFLHNEIEVALAKDGNYYLLINSEFATPISFCPFCGVGFEDQTGS